MGYGTEMINLNGKKKFKKKAHFSCLNLLAISSVQLLESVTKMNFKNASILINNEEFYATVMITKTCMVINPDDITTRIGIWINEARLIGVKGLESPQDPYNRSIEINLTMNATYRITFRSITQKIRALAAISTLMSDSSGSGDEEEEDSD
ncbi:hypothetical protein ABEB36_014278 [Hypothenemus hampei]|uniref:Uncharacterized protein n=1 Tax=Hypothenemus hampei TaxID=57062 RepID=A0ABD1E483_HYPHA